MASVIARQTTFWEIADTAGQYRVSFRGKEEHSYSSSPANSWEIVGSHPLLVDYAFGSERIYIAGCSECPGSLLIEFEERIAEESGGWRAASDYLNAEASAIELLRYGHGLLAEAPTPVSQLFQSVLRDHGVEYSVLAGRPRRWPRQALVVGRSFVVAREFAVAET